MSAGWYYKSSAGEIGPLSAAELRRHATSGAVTVGTPVRRADTERWVNAGNVKGLFTSPPSQKGPSPVAAALPSGKNAATSQNVLGKWVVKYDCPKCELRLKSRIGEAGETDACPECSCEFIIPAQAKRLEIERLAAEQAAEAERLKELQLAEAQAKREKQEREEAEAAALKHEQLKREQDLWQQAQVKAQQEVVVHATALVRCPYCHGEINRGVQKCRHCGEFLVGTEHSDVLAGCLGFLLGPIGLWYKGQYLAGFAWIAACFLFIAVTGGIGILFAPFFWLGMGIHAALAKGAR